MVQTVPSEDGGYHGCCVVWKDVGCTGLPGLGEKRWSALLVWGKAKCAGS